MSFQDPPRRQRQPRYPALAQYENGYPSYQDTAADQGGGNGYQGFAGLAGVSQQRAPWDDPWQPVAWDAGAQWPVRDTGAQWPVRDTGAQQAVRDTSTQQAVPATGTSGSWWNTGGQRAVPTTGLTTATGAQRRASGAFGAATSNHRRPDRGLLPGALAGFLAAAVALGVANLVAAFVRPQASPIIAVGGAFIDRTPSALKNFAVQKFGENDKNMLLLGMYVTIALLAFAIGMIAWRRVAIGVAGIGLFGLFGAFVAITRPESHVTDVIPSIVGGVAGIAAIIWLVRSGVPGARVAWARRR